MPERSVQNTVWDAPVDQKFADSLGHDSSAASNRSSSSLRYEAKKIHPAAVSAAYFSTGVPSRRTEDLENLERDLCLKVRTLEKPAAKPSGPLFDNHLQTRSLDQKLPPPEKVEADGLLNDSWKKSMSPKRKHQKSSRRRMDLEHHASAPKLLTNRYQGELEHDLENLESDVLRKDHRILLTPRATSSPSITCSPSAGVENLPSRQLNDLEDQIIHKTHRVVSSPVARLPPPPAEENRNSPSARMIRQLDTMEDQILVKGNASARDMERMRQIREERHYNGDELAPPPPGLLRAPLPTLSRRVTKDIAQPIIGSSLGPGAYRESVMRLHDDEESMTHSERRLNMTDSERQLEEDREIEAARIHYMASGRRSTPSSRDQSIITYETIMAYSDHGEEEDIPPQDESDEPLRPDIEAMEGKKSKCGRKALLGVILFTVLVSLAVGLGLALGGTSSGSFQPTIVENCKYDVYGLSEECESKGSIEAVPHCIHERYVALETELHLPRTSPTGDCTPSRLALLSMSYTNQRAYTATYVLSTLFYTTGGSLWKRKEGWLTSESVCAWEGVKCKVVCYDSGAGSQTCQLDPGELRELNLEDNALKGLLPIELGLLVTMERLNLKSNALSGTIPESLSSMNSLTTLDLSLNADMGGIIPDTISKLSRLREFLMEGLQVSGSLPTQVGGMTSLERLVLSRNRISGALPSEIGKLANLEDLMIDENDLTGSIPTQLGGCTHLTSLILYQNTLTGTLPVELGRLTKLSSLSLGLNSFHPGPLPSEIPLQLTNLSSLFLTSASLTGTLSTEIGSLTNLSELYLSENRFTGLLPTEVGLCKDLRVFEVASNNFRGQIPTQFGSLTSLEILSLIDNSFTGTIPTELGMNINLFRLVFATNRLTGLIPAEVCNLWNHKLLELGTYTGSCSNDAYGGASCPNNACCPNCQTSG